MKKVLSVLSSVLLTSSVLAQETNTFVDEMGNINAVKNQIFFKTKGTKAYIMSPMTYLNENDRRKTEALEYIDDRFNKMIVDWNKFAYKFHQLEDQAGQKILNSTDEQQIEELVEFIESDSDKRSMQKMILKYTGLPTFEQRQANEFLAQYSSFSESELKELLAKTEEQQLDAFLAQINAQQKVKNPSKFVKKFPEEYQEDVQKLLYRSYNQQLQSGQLKVLYSNLKPKTLKDNGLDEMLTGTMSKMTRGLLDFLMEIKKSEKSSFFSSTRVSPLEKHFQTVVNSKFKVDVDRVEDILEISDSFDRMQAFSSYFHEVKLEDQDLYGKSYAENFSFAQVKALAKRQLERANALITNDGFTIGNDRELPSQLELENQNIEEYNKNMAYLLNNTIEIREDFEKAFNNLAVLTDEEQKALKHSFHSSLPDVYLIQFQGRAIERAFGFGKKIAENPGGGTKPGIGNGGGFDIGNDIGNDLDSDGKQDPTKIKHKPTWLERFVSNHPSFVGTYNAINGVIRHKVRFAFFIRPWAITEIDLNTGHKKEYIDYETSFNVLLSVNPAEDSLITRSDNFFRVSVGGIWANMKNLEDLDKNMFVGGSYTKGMVNLKGGVTHPLLEAPKLPGGFSREDMPEKVGAYFMVGGQRGEEPIPYIGSDSTDGNLDPEAKKIAEKQGFYARALARLKNKPYLDISVNKNLVDIFDAIGVDSSNLSDELRRLLNLDNNGGSGGAYDCPSWICGDDGNGIIGGNGNGGGGDIPIIGGSDPIIIDEPGGGIFISEDIEDFMLSYMDDNKEEYRKCWLSLPDIKRRQYFIDMHFRKYSTLCLPLEKMVEKRRLMKIELQKSSVQEVDFAPEESK